MPPRKKTKDAGALPIVASALEGAGKIKIDCPACKSSISSNGSTLYAKSGYLNDLIDTDKSVEELEKEVTALEKKLQEALTALTEMTQKAATEAANNVGKEKPKRWGW
jgi:hypothetical protein